MKQVTREEYARFVNERNLFDHPTDGHRLSVMQWLNKEKKVLAQATYERVVPGEKVTVSYYIEEN